MKNLVLVLAAVFAMSNFVNADEHAAPAAAEAPAAAAPAAAAPAEHAPEAAAPAKKHGKKMKKGKKAKPAAETH